MQGDRSNFPKWGITRVCGYVPITTFWQDFSIAERFGTNAIKDTYRKVKQEWADDYKYWTELVLVLNHKIWDWYEKDEGIARTYDALWRDADALTDDWEGEELAYYLRTTD